MLSDETPLCPLNSDVQVKPSYHPTYRYLILLYPQQVKVLLRWTADGATFKLADRTNFDFETTNY